MVKIDKIIIIVIGLSIILLAACSGLEARPSEPIAGIDEPITTRETTITLLDASIRNSMQTYYLMTYPAEAHVYYRLTLAIQQDDVEPEEILAWGVDNLHLVHNETRFAVSQSQRIIGQDNVEYKIDEDFNFQYAYFFEVPEDANFSEFQLQLPDDQKIAVGLVVEIPTQAHNQDIELHAVSAGGSQNIASAYHATVGGGQLNNASASHTTVGGGRENIASYFYATVGGGYANSATARDTVIGGGSRNTASNAYATVGDGIQNNAFAPNSTIAGGAYNEASDDFATIAGGTRNIASGFSSTIGGGAGNMSSADQTTVSGGLGNQAMGVYASIGGGHGNVGGGNYSSIPGGYLNEAHGDFSLAAGHQAIVDENHSGVFLFADSTGFEFQSEAENEFAVRATGGVRLVTSIDTTGNPLTGSILPAGSGAWSTLSDRNLKGNIQPIDHNQILTSIVELPISSWHYRGQDSSVQHLGPMAQDFYTTFGLGENDRFISTVDADGVALAGIQGLFQLVKEQDALIQSQQSEIAALEDRMPFLERNQPASHWYLWFSLLILMTNIGMWVHHQKILTRMRK